MVRYSKEFTTHHARLEGHRQDQLASNRLGLKDCFERLQCRLFNYGKVVYDEDGGPVIKERTEHCETLKHISSSCDKAVSSLPTTKARKERTHRPADGGIQCRDPPLLWMPFSSMFEGRTVVRMQIRRKMK